MNLIRLALPPLLILSFAQLDGGLAAIERNLGEPATPLSSESEVTEIVDLVEDTQQIEDQHQQPPAALPANQLIFALTSDLSDVEDIVGLTDSFLANLSVATNNITSAIKVAEVRLPNYLILEKFDGGSLDELVEELASQAKRANSPLRASEFWRKHCKHSSLGNECRHVAEEDFEDDASQGAELYHAEPPTRIIPERTPAAPRVGGPFRFVLTQDLTDYDLNETMDFVDFFTKSLAGVIGTDESRIKVMQFDLPNKLVMQLSESSSDKDATSGELFDELKTQLSNRSSAFFQTPFAKTACQKLDTPLDSAIECAVE